jgi:hydroxymethylbilane synthase
VTTPDPTWFDRPLRIGTRRSQLALWQANHVKSTLEQHWGERLTVELVEIVTEGDRILDRPLAQVGGKGLFVKGIEDKLLSEDVDLAVHSMKDLPAHLPDGLVINCTPPRADPKDALVSKSGQALADLPEGTRLGTSSLRRGALALRLNPGLEVVSIRGNVPTRLKKVDDGEVDATLLACAGLERLGLGDRITERLDVERFCPAACQGILALECRDADARAKALCEPMEDARARVAAEAERAFLRRLEGGCQVPMGCYAHVSEGGDTVSVRGVVVGDEGRPYLFAVETGPAGQAADLGDAVASQLLSMGADKVIAALDDGS